MAEKILVYPVILKQEAHDVFVTIPDIDGGYTQGDNVEDAIRMAQDAMGNLLEDVDGKDYPQASNPNDLNLQDDENLVYVAINIDDFKRRYSKTVRTNVTIPKALKEKAKREHINLSRVLTDALYEVVK
ncbi:type II toxin-antitoxin system HicB family antitoxin [Fructilactobacillus cliffordii]|uniref:type II toxin-antitoxin system HicB family antitoxin n=1 Tax=Fructilactobacillus cliffordii TaxID=2940299 RepID=UPI002093B18B|nr:type II toxin-antitoxin system HicB family antitoxin [Fructilactobacillus cliffordii]USS86890.1 type II toxin-antitoxin system HicB family antitoxin [Fructilactobacillus cliffordii]